jgi:predicted PurR-regulated permease PerM
VTKIIGPKVLKALDDALIANVLGILMNPVYDILTQRLPMKKLPAKLVLKMCEIL